LKRTIFAAGALALAAGIFVMPNALAEPSDECGGTPVANDTDSATVCVTEGPVTGNATAAGSPGPPPDGYVIADGDSTNEGALVGYIGVDGGGFASSGCPDPYAGETAEDDLDPAGTVEFITSGGESDCG